MHRLMVIQLNHSDPNHFRVVADSADASVSEANPSAIPDAAGGAGWEEFDDSTGYSSPYATVPCEAKVTDLGYWHVNKTGNILDVDFADAGLSERKVITSGSCTSNTMDGATGPRQETACSSSPTPRRRRTSPSSCASSATTNARSCTRSTSCPSVQARAVSRNGR